MSIVLNRLPPSIDRYPLTGLLSLLVSLSLLLCPARFAAAQTTTDLQTPSTANAQQVSGMPASSDLGRADSRVFSPARIFSKPSGSGSALDLKARPSTNTPPSVVNNVSTTPTVTTSIVTQGENKEVKESAPPKLTLSTSLGTVGLDFASWVRQSVGTALPVFGASVFNAGSSKTQALDPMTIPADYRVGPGDELLVRAWGQIDIDFQGPIDRSGTLFLPQVGTVMVAGQKIADLHKLLSTTLSKQYKNFELTVSLGSLRQIQYYVTGFAKQTGVHTTESTATALHGLIAAGGLLPEGDLRRIELRRGDAPPILIDAYAFLVHGQRTQDPQLLPGDVLHVPAASGFVAVAGNVRRAAMYHLVPNMTVAQALALAGGVALGQGSGQVRIRRERLGTARSADARLGARSADILGDDAHSLAQSVQDGDVLMVLPISPRFDAVVSVSGNVAHPLRQGFVAGMRVSDVLDIKTSFIRPAVWAERQSRLNLEGLGKTSRSTNPSAANADFSPDFANDFPDVNWSYAAIERFDPSTQALHVLPFHLGRALAKDAEHDLALQAGDTVFVYAKTDFKQPEQEVQRLVRIEGEVSAPGLYPLLAGETLPQLIARAGGLTPRAYVYGTHLSRAQARKSESVMLKETADRIEQDYFRYLAGRARNSVGQEDASVGYPELDAIKTLVQRLRTAEPEGRVALDLKNDKALLRHLPDLVLEDLDRITIPARPATVTVMGAVFRQGSLLWNTSYNARQYVENSGGLRPYADRSNFVIFRADGTVRQAGNSWFSSWGEPISPGDTIMVAEDVQSSSWTRVFRDWSQIFYQLGLGTAALKILRSSL